MGGERLRVPGYAEVSAICTDPDYRGRNLATGVLAHVAQGILDRAKFLSAYQNGQCSRDPGV